MEIVVTDELIKWRSEFPILDQTVYLISHSLGAMPRETYERSRSLRAASARICCIARVSWSEYRSSFHGSACM